MPISHYWVLHGDHRKKEIYRQIGSSVSWQRFEDIASSKVHI